MRAIPLILVLLAGCGPGANGTASSFAVDSCDPQPAQVDAIELWHSGAAMKVGDYVARAGGQGLPMADVGVRLTPPTATCVLVAASSGAHAESGGLKVDPSGTLEIVMGPVDYSFSMDVVIAGHTAHVDTRDGIVSAIR